MLQQRLPIEEAFVKELQRTGRLVSGNKDRDARLLAAFLASDFHATAVGTLPVNVKEMMHSILPGRHFLQIDEIVNIGTPLKSRFEERGKDRMLKFHLTDGKQQVVGIEYRNIPELGVLSPAGIKIVVTDGFVHQGILMLCPENVEVLGGSVARLVRAQEAAKAVLMKEPRPGKERQQIGKLYEDAELVAWDSEQGRPLPSSPVPTRTEPRPPPRPQPTIAPALIQKGATKVNKENTKPPPQSQAPRTTVYSQKPQKELPRAVPAQHQHQAKEQCSVQETIVIADSPVQKQRLPSSTFDVIDLLNDE